MNMKTHEFEADLTGEPNLLKIRIGKLAPNDPEQIRSLWNDKFRL
jgi:hypothetical protein